MQLEVILPILICLFSLILCLATWQHHLLQKIVHGVSSLSLFIVVVFLYFSVNKNGILIYQLGGYPAPFGISFVIDQLSALMLVVTGIIIFSVSLYALGDISRRQQSVGFYPLFWSLATGIVGSFSTGDLFNLYVWFEVMLISSFVLMVLGNSKAQLEGAIKYVALNLLSTTLMLFAIALLYGMTGTLNMADLSVKLSNMIQQDKVTLVLTLLLIAFAIKSSLFPFFFWLPASYHATSFSASAVFAGMLTKVGVYALIRLVLLFSSNNMFILQLLIILSTLTMLTGVFGAASQFNFRRILSFHIISQIGYMVMGLAIYTPLAIAASVFYIVHHIIVKTNLYLISGVTFYLEKSSDIKKLGGLYQRYPVLALLFLIPALSLAGIPPLSGFWAKYILLEAAFRNYNYVVATVALLVGILTLYSMIKIWFYVFWREHKLPQTAPISKQRKGLLIAPVFLLSSTTLMLGLAPQFLFKASDSIANQLTHRQLYIDAVLGGKV